MFTFEHFFSYLPPIFSVHKEECFSSRFHMESCIHLTDRRGKSQVGDRLRITRKHDPPRDSYSPILTACGDKRNHKPQFWCSCESIMMRYHEKHPHTAPNVSLLYASVICTILYWLFMKPQPGTEKHKGQMWERKPKRVIIHQTWRNQHTREGKGPPSLQELFHSQYRKVTLNAW